MEFSTVLGIGLLLWALVYLAVALLTASREREDAEPVASHRAARDEYDGHGKYLQAARRESRSMAGFTGLTLALFAGFVGPWVLVSHVALYLAAGKPLVAWIIGVPLFIFVMFAGMQLAGVLLKTERQRAVLALVIAILFLAVK